MQKKIMKALRDLNAYIDNDREKLYDRIHDLELSHKRMEKLLIRSKDLMKDIADYCPDSKFPDMLRLVCIITAELSNPYLRHNWKLKGGKHA